MVAIRPVSSLAGLDPASRLLAFSQGLTGV